MIEPTLPGAEYGVRVPEDRADGARVFVNRKALARWCGALLPPRPAVAEVGVFGGAFSRWLLDELRPGGLLLIDTFCADDHVNGEFTAGSHRAFVEAAFADRPEVSLRAGVSWEQLAALPDDSLDYVYVDADHSYDAVRRDIAAAYDSLRSGGIMQFNDYANYGSFERAPYGVLDAVNEFIEAREEVHIVGLSLERSGYHDLAVRVVKPPPAAPGLPLVLVTPCSRPENLDAVRASIDFSRVETWFVIYDTRHAPFERRFAGDPQIVEAGCGEAGVAGHQIRNQFLDGLRAGAPAKLVYFLDDDNAVHPAFWDVSRGWGRGLFTFDMAYADGTVRRGDAPVVNEIDTAQVVFSTDLLAAAGGDVRFDARAYNADGVFANELFRRHGGAWTYVPRVAATYNRLRPGVWPAEPGA